MDTIYHIMIDRFYPINAEFEERDLMEETLRV